MADATGQKRKEAATTPSQGRAKAKSADPVGQKRKSTSASEEASPSPGKLKATEPTGEKRKADSDAEDMEDAVGQGSPTKPRVEEDEDIKRATALPATMVNTLQLHSGPDIATKAEKLGMKTMDLGHWDIDNISNRDRITELVREKKPAFIIGRPQSRAVGHI